MIPIRARVDSPITTFGVRPPMSPEHPLAGTPCPACGGSLTEAPITFVFVGVDPGQRAEGKTWVSAGAVVVHADCAGLDPAAPARETDADEDPEPADGDHGTCATCGGQVRYDTFPGGGRWIHEAQTTDDHNAQLGGPA